MNLSEKRLVIVTPVYEDREAATRLFGVLSAQFGAALFLVAVDDGSVREPLDIECLRAAGLDGAVLRLRRNVGHQQAIAIGLGYVAEHIGPRHEVVVMDSDGEDMPATIPRLLDRLRADDVDVVVAQREKRVETVWFKAFYAIYKRFFSLMTGRAISFGNFMALKAHAVRRLVSMQELSVHVAGTVLASKLRTGLCALPRGPRYAGQSRMNFVGLTLHGFKGLMVFAEDVLVRVGIACTLTAALSVVGAIVAVALKLAGFSTPGWFSVVLGILVLIFLQTGALALMTLMLTGVMRGGTVASSTAYLAFVDEVLETGQEAATP
ncbi:glycosyltransferase [Nitratireductor sp. CAU 1489]|uniref:Glycosyltransferase n=1 Tax=Nitratireductor arenosus TaxID=2682096 RepID=A0A844QES3_9HYPH|nr:glycosyltransferase [Nitratireductor arenosus]MVA97832.1 glycosyltransferase [Nitratireductor arenosus]